MELVPKTSPGTPGQRRPRWRSGAQVAVLVAAAVVVTLVLVARLAAAQHAVQSAAQQRGVGGTLAGPQRGQAAPDFTLHTWAWLDDSSGARARPDQTLQLAALRGHPVVLNFWASWCDPCRQEASVLEAAWRTYGPRGVVFLGVDVNDNAPDSASFVKQYGITYFTGPDVTETIDVNYAVAGIPTTAFIDRRGIIAGRAQGALTPSFLDRQLAALLN